MARVRVALEHLLHLEREPVHALAHVGAAGGQPDPRPARERDHRPASARSAAATTAGSAGPVIRTRSPPASSTSIRGGAARRRHGRDRHRREARHRRRGRREPGLGPQPLAPGEELAGADPAPPRHPVHRLARRERLGHQPPLVVLRPAPTRPPLEDLDPAHPLAPSTGLTTPRQTRRSGDPPRSRQPRKAALPGGILKGTDLNG